MPSSTDKCLRFSQSHHPFFVLIRISILPFLTLSQTPCPISVFFISRTILIVLLSPSSLTFRMSVACSHVFSHASLVGPFAIPPRVALLGTIGVPYAVFQQIASCPVHSQIHIPVMSYILPSAPEKPRYDSSPLLLFFPVRSGLQSQLLMPVQAGAAFS